MHVQYCADSYSSEDCADLPQAINTMTFCRGLGYVSLLSSVSQAASRHQTTCVCGWRVWAADISTVTSGRRLNEMNAPYFLFTSQHFNSIDAPCHYLLSRLCQSKDCPTTLGSPQISSCTACLGLYPQLTTNLLLTGASNVACRMTRCLLLLNTRCNMK